MPIGGFGGPTGRRVRSVERALTASALLPTVAFAALGAVTVLLVVQLGISPLGAVGGPSGRDGGHGVTMPRMSITIGPQRLQRAAPTHDRESTTANASTALELARPVALTIAPTRGRETTTADAANDSTRPTRLARPTGPTRPSMLIFARTVAHTLPPTTDRETTTPDVESAAMTAAVTDVAVSNPTVIYRTATIWEVTTAAVEPQVQVGTDAREAPEVMYALLARAAAPAATGPALEVDDLKPQTPQNEDTSGASVKTPQNADATQASEHAKAAKSGD